MGEPSAAQCAVIGGRQTADSKKQQKEVNGSKLVTFFADAPLLTIMDNARIVKVEDFGVSGVYNTLVELCGEMYTRLPR